MLVMSPERFAVLQQPLCACPLPVAGSCQQTQHPQPLSPWLHELLVTQSGCENAQVAINAESPKHNVLAPRSRARNLGHILQRGGQCGVNPRTHPYSPHASPALPHSPPCARWLLSFPPFPKKEQISLSARETAGLPQLGSCQPSAPCQAAALAPTGEAPSPAAPAPPPISFLGTGRIHTKSWSCLALFLSSHCLSSPPHPRCCLPSPRSPS